MTGGGCSEKEKEEFTDKMMHLMKESIRLTEKMVEGREIGEWREVPDELLSKEEEKIETEEKIEAEDEIEKTESENDVEEPREEAAGYLKSRVRGFSLL